MAYNYVDEHRLIRYRGGQARDITAFAGDLQAVDELGLITLAGKERIALVAPRYATDVTGGSEIGRASCRERV